MAALRFPGGEPPGPPPTTGGPADLDRVLAALGAERRGPAAAACVAAERAFGLGARLRAAGGGLDALRCLEPERRAFAWEGAGLFDVLAGRDAPEDATTLEWTFWALGDGMARAMRGLPIPPDPLEAEGHGFAEAIVRTARALDAAPGLVAWDVGVGRALWFVHAGAVPRIRAAVRSCDPARRGWLWQGVGRAAVFAGGGPADRIAALVATAEEHGDAVRAGADEGAELRRAWGRGASEAWPGPRGAPTERTFVPGIAAIRGVGVVSAAGVGREALMALLRSGGTGIRPVERFPTEGFAARTAALVPGYDTPRMTPALDGRAQELAVEWAREAIGEAVEAAARPAKPATMLSDLSVPPTGSLTPRPPLPGGPGGEGEEEQEAPAPVTALVVGTNLEDRPVPLDVLFGRLADELGIDGPRVVVSTACASGTSALGHALEILLRGEADRVIAGGVDVITPRVFAGFSVLGALTDRAAPFSTPPGMTLGEGAAFLVLERATSADSTCVLGHGLAADAFHETQPAPDGHGVAAAVRSALAHAGLSADAVRYVNAHGTGTAANDAPEWLGIRAGLGGREPPTSSQKGLLGHAQGAAGALEVALTLACRAEGLLPPTVGFGAPRPGAPPDPVPTLRVGDASTFLSCSSAFTGVNAAVIVGPARAVERPRRPVRVVSVGVWGPAPGEREAPVATAGDVPRGVDPDAYGIPVGWLCAAVAKALADAGVRLDRSVRARTGLVLGLRSVVARDGKALGDEIAARGLGGVSGSVFARALLVTPAGGVATALGLLGPVDVVCGAESGGIALVHAATLLGARPELDHVIAAAVDDVEPGCGWGGAAVAVLGTKGGRALHGWGLGGTPEIAEARVAAGLPGAEVHRSGGRCEGTAACEGLLAMAERFWVATPTVLVGGRSGLGWGVALGGLA